MPRRIRFQRSCARGWVLLDGLIAIVIFSIGILGMVALQAVAVKLTTDAKYRTDAAMLADRAIAQMWGADPAALSANFAGTNGSGGKYYVQWEKTVADSLPGVTGNEPSIAINGNNLVTVTVNWLAPNDKSPTNPTPAAHSYVSITQITR